MTKWHHWGYYVQGRCGQYQEARGANEGTLARQGGPSVKSSSQPKHTFRDGLCHPPPIGLLLRQESLRTFWWKFMPGTFFINPKHWLCVFVWRSVHSSSQCPVDTGITQPIMGICVSMCWNWGYKNKVKAWFSSRQIWVTLRLVLGAQLERWLSWAELLQQKDRLSPATSCPS